MPLCGGEADPVELRGRRWESGWEQQRCGDHHDRTHPGRPAV